MTALCIPTGHYVMVVTKWSLSTECVVQHDSPVITNIPQPASEEMQMNKSIVAMTTHNHTAQCIVMRSHEM